MRSAARRAVRIAAAAACRLAARYPAFQDGGRTSGSRSHLNRAGGAVQRAGAAFDAQVAVDNLRFPFLDGEHAAGTYSLAYTAARAELCIEFKRNDIRYVFHHLSTYLR